MNKKTAILSIIILIGLSGFYIFRDSEPEVIEEEEEEVVLESTLEEIETVFQLEDELLALEETGVVEEDTVEDYYDLENRYFVLIDEYYEGDLTREKLAEEVDKLLEDIEELEEKITNLNN